jgi:hypothetical protein
MRALWSGCARNSDFATSRSRRFGRAPVFEHAGAARGDARAPQRRLRHCHAERGAVAAPVGARPEEGPPASDLQRGGRGNVFIRRNASATARCAPRSVCRRSRS